MGLDISAISELKSLVLPDNIVKHSDEYYDWEQEQSGPVYTIWQHHGMPEYLDGIPKELHDDIGEGLVTANGESYGFRAGSYSGYGEWRDDLAQAANYGSADNIWQNPESVIGRPFVELINFSDAEGIIGPVMSEKLYMDFVEQEENIMKKVDEWYLKFDPEKEYDGDTVKWFRSKYNDWKQAFNIARNNGAVIFH